MIGKKTKQILTLFLLVDIAITLLVVLSYFAILKTNSEGAALKDQIINVRQKIANVEKEKNLFAEIEKDARKVESFIVAKDGVVDFVERVEKLGENLNLKTETRSIATESAAIQERLNVILSAEGSWQNVFRFIKLLELLPFNVSVKDVGLENVNAQDKKNLWVLNTTISVVKVK